MRRGVGTTARSTVPAQYRIPPSLPLPCAEVPENDGKARLSVRESRGRCFLGPDSFPAITLIFQGTRRRPESTTGIIVWWRILGAVLVLNLSLVCVDIYIGNNFNLQGSTKTKEELKSLEKQIAERQKKHREERKGSGQTFNARKYR